MSPDSRFSGQTPAFEWMSMRVSGVEWMSEHALWSWEWNGRVGSSTTESHTESSTAGFDDSIGIVTVPKRRHVYDGLSPPPS